MEEIKNAANVTFDTTNNMVVKEIYKFGFEAYCKQMHMLALKEQMEKCKSADELEAINNRLNEMVDEYNAFVEDHCENYKNYEGLVNGIIGMFEVARDAKKFALVEEA